MGVASIEEQVTALMRGSEFGDDQIKAIMTQELRQRLTEARQEVRSLRVYCGYDVTAPDIHLGHTITMRKLRQFQEFGHEVTFLIGTFTTLIGDPSDRDTGRAQAQLEHIMRNAETYADQAFRILDRKKTKIQYNYDWLSKLSFGDVLGLASHFTVQQLLARDRIRNRMDRNDPISLREFLYPLGQGYDAVALQADVQLGATEQLFNLMAGRKLQEVFGQKPQICLTFPVLVGTDGEMRMSKSTGNYIGVSEAPENIFGKIMSIPDKLILHYFLLLTNTPQPELNEFQKCMDAGENPMELKKRLGREIVTELYDATAATEAEAHFAKVVQNKEVPNNIPTLVVMEAEPDVRRLLVDNNYLASMSEATRLIKQGGVKIDGEKLTAFNAPLKDGSVIQAGKRLFVKIERTGN